MLTAMASLLGGTLWMWVRHRQFLQYFYSSEFLALTHVITLGCVTSLMMGVILRLAPMSLRVNPRSARLARVQFGPSLRVGRGSGKSYRSFSW